MIKLQQLINAGVSPLRAQTFLGPLIAACERFEINTPIRIAAFVAQTRIESNGYTNLEEGLYYRDPARVMNIFKSSVKSLEQARGLIRNGKALANTVYANRMGNGSIESGDGFRFRGRGIIQLTFRGNYAAAAEGTGRPYVEQPELLCQPEDAALASAWYWYANKINAPADLERTDSVTRLINRGMMHAKERRDAYQLARNAFLKP